MRLIGVLVFLLLSGASVAQETEYSMRAGLWQITTSSDLLKLVPHIPASQRQQIEALAKEYGVDMPQINNGAAISQLCVTPEMAQQTILPHTYQEQTGCVSQTATRNGNHYKATFSCNGADLKGQGMAEGSLTSDQSFSGQTQFSGHLQGSPVNERAEFTGQWVNADCGTVKPLQ